MKFTVAWTKQAENELTQIWLDSVTPQAVTEAVDQIDAHLIHDAHLLGESREAGLRILHNPPIGIAYSINMPDRIAKVLHVWFFETPRN